MRCSVVHRQAEAIESSSSLSYLLGRIDGERTVSGNPDFDVRSIRPTDRDRMASLKDEVLAKLAAIAAPDGRPLPDVPRHGNGGSGEISALGALFGSIGAERQLQLKESMSLINGSPCASALTADAALCAADLIGWAQRLFGLAATALGVSAEIFDARLDELWGDPFQAEALAALREQLGHTTAGQEADVAVGHVQPPVSFRIIPRVVLRRPVRV